MQLFLDLDGVLADFDKAALTLFKMPSKEAEGVLGKKEFWRQIRKNNFYLNLPLMQDAKGLFDAVKHLSPIILTGCPFGGWAEKEKVSWVATHFPGTEIITCLSAQKFQYGKPGDVLIDDTPKYKQKWLDMGGIWIDHTSAYDSLRKLWEIFPDLQK